MTAKPIVTIAAALLALLLAGCGSTLAPPSHDPPAAAPAPTQTTRPIPATRADRKVCHRFLNQEQNRAGGNAWMAWATFGRGEKTSNHASGRLITATVKWFDDTYQSWGNPADGSSDWADVLELCASAGVSG